MNSRYFFPRSLSQALWVSGKPRIWYQSRKPLSFYWYWWIYLLFWYGIYFFWQIYQTKSFSLTYTNIQYEGNQDLDTTKLSALDTKATIVVYGDITISSDYTVGATILPRAIIALKDADGNGGNISIKNSVSRLDTSLIAEKSLLSGDPSGTLYYTDLSNATGVLDKQLYVYGSIISLNTIGWASIPGAPVCPQSIDACSGSVPLRYDFEHFRYYRGASPAPLARSAAGLSIEDKKASFIIEYDSRITTNPPPGLAPIR